MPYKLTLLMLGLCFAMLASASGAPGAAGHADARSTFVLLNAMTYKEMPHFGTRMPVIYESTFFQHGHLADGVSPSDEGIARAATKARRLVGDKTWPITAQMVALDIERWGSWPFESLAQTRRSARLYRQTAARFKKTAELPMCFYAVFPNSGIAISTQAVRDEKYRAQWQQANKIIAHEVLETLDILCPQLYTYYDTPGADGRQKAIDQWKRFASDTVALARQFAPGKKVYPFIWPQFHAGGTFKDYPYVPAEYWRAQLEHLKTIADGAILWGGYDFAHKDQQTWSPDAPWWQVLQQVFPQQTGTNTITDSAQRLPAGTQLK